MLLALQRDYQEYYNKPGTYSDEFLVLGIFAILGKHAQESLLAVQGLANLVQSFHKTYVHP